MQAMRSGVRQDMKLGDGQTMISNVESHQDRDRPQALAKIVNQTQMIDTGLMQEMIEIGGIESPSMMTLVNTQRQALPDANMETAFKIDEEVGVGVEALIEGQDRRETQGP